MSKWKNENLFISLLEIFSKMEQISKERFSMPYMLSKFEHLNSGLDYSFIVDVRRRVKILI